MTIQDLKDADVIQQAIDKAKNDPMRPLLVINCITYNHAPYLAQCLEGFVMQKTNFPFVALVHDDASPDGTAEVLREYAEKYPDIIKPICDTINRYSDKSLDLIMNEWINAYEPKYIAYCEGDDYWIDPLKLQKQVDALEKSKAGMCYSDYEIYAEKIQQRTLIKPTKNISYDIHWQVIAQDIMIGTQTVVILREAHNYIKEAYKADFQGYIMGDTQLWFHCARLYNTVYLNATTAVYRKNPVGVTSMYNLKGRIKFLRNALDLHLHLANTYHAPIYITEYIKSIFGKSLLYLCLESKDFDTANEIVDIISLNCFKKRLLLLFERNPRLLIVFSGLIRKLFIRII